MSAKEQPTLESTLKTIQEIRKNPLLLLNILEVEKPSLLYAHKLLHGKKYETLDVVLQTPGGDIDAAFSYCKLLRKSAKVLNIIVPLFAKSAGTLICLVADKILMTELSELGPLDTQIRETQDGDSPAYNSALRGFKALEQIQKHNIVTLDTVTKLILARSEMKMSEAIHLATEFSGQTSGTLYRHLNPNKIGEYARALEIGEYYGKTVLTRYKNWNERIADVLINKLVYKYPSHGYVIDCEELQALGLPAEFVDNETANQLFLVREMLLNSHVTTIDLMEYESPKPEVNGVPMKNDPSNNKELTQPRQNKKTQTKEVKLIP